LPGSTGQSFSDSREEDATVKPWHDEWWGPTDRAIFLGSHEEDATRPWHDESGRARLEKMLQ
jgi:hypothetical protein